ncbi:MAG: HAD-IC family P-type ATPase [Bacteroidales bacterium]
MEIDQDFAYYRTDKDTTIEKLNSNSESGLKEAEAKKRLKELGKNELPQKRSTGIFQLAIRQFKDFLVLILFIAAIISYLTGHMVDVYVIAGVILINAAIGFFQEYKAEKSIEALQKLVKHNARILRNGKEKTVEATELVPGDILFLQEGKSIPADARLLEVKNFSVNESSLTGESVPVTKETKALDEDISLADRKNMIYKGTYVARGSCKAIITATGPETELGKIASSMQEMGKKESEFRKKTRKLAKIMAGIAIATSIIVFLIGYFWRDFAFDDILLVTIAVLVSSIPEGLPAVLSIVLAIGANRMASQNAIIREFTATETAGSLTVILTDKTGTITQSILTVKKVFVPGQKEYSVSGSGYEPEGELRLEEEPVGAADTAQLKKTAIIAGFCNDATVKRTKDGEPSVSGDPTEVSLAVFAKKASSGKEDLFEGIQRVDDLPFNAEQKFRGSLIEFPDDHRELLFAGAPETILSLSTDYLGPDGKETLDDETKKEINAQIKDMTGEAMRVIGYAYRKADQGKDVADPEDAKDLVFTGLFGIIDPPRPEVKKAVAECTSAGIRVVMVTGDHKRTAYAIAKEIGITDPKEHKNGDCPAVLTEQELEVDDETFSRYTGCTNVFARVTPKTKLRIAKDLQSKKHLIGMTGDGVNDAPALKKADVGIAMGQRGTDVARDASQIVLSDDNFASIVNAIKEGRIVFRNIRLTSFFLVTTNFASALTIISAIAIGFTYPLLPTQILWINLVTDGIMDISIATEPDHGEIMKEKPRKKGDPILNKQIFPYLLVIVPVMVILSLLVFNYYHEQSIDKARTGVFLVVAMTQVFNAFNMRSLKKSAFTIGFFKNKWVNLAFVVSLILQIAAIKLPFMQHIFHFENIEWVDIALIIVLSSLVFIFGELYKWIKNRFFRKA